MGENDMFPRITVPDDTDAEVVFAALVDYQVSNLARMRLAGYVDVDILRAAHRAGQLALIVGAEIQNTEIRRLAGEIPDDISGLDGENRS
jgi:hypothetical protein